MVDELAYLDPSVRILDISLIKVSCLSSVDERDVSEMIARVATGVPMDPVSVFEGKSGIRLS